MLQINNLHVSVEGKEIIKDVSLEIKPGEVHAVMGPNGSGKSTLAYALAGHPKYKITKSKAQSPNIEQETENKKQIAVDGVDISEMAPDERAREGLYLATQHPMSVPGLTTINFLWQIYKSRNPKPQNPKSNEKKQRSLLEFRKWMTEQAKALGLDEGLLKRGLNDGFSGGEKKKTEVLQMLVASSKYVILDEIDSGLDVDAIKKIGRTVAKMSQVNKIGVLIITHNSRILNYLKPDYVHMIKEGNIVEEGGAELAQMIENKGFEKEDHVEIRG